MCEMVIKSDLCNLLYYGHVLMKGEGSQAGGQFTKERTNRTNRPWNMIVYCRLKACHFHDAAAAGKPHKSSSFAPFELNV